MKIIDVIKYRDNGSGTGTIAGMICWRVLPDSIFIRSNNPFFVPDFPGGVDGFPAIAVKVNRVGKGIANRFAYRYISEIAPAVIFRAESYGRELAGTGFPVDPAFIFDRAVILGEFKAIGDSIPSYMELSATLYSVNGSEDSNPEQRGAIGNFREEVALAVESFTLNNTLKTGDILLLHPSSLQNDKAESRFPALPDSHLALSISIPEREDSLDMNINIK